MRGIGSQFGDEKLENCNPPNLVEDVTNDAYLDKQVPFNKEIDWSTYFSHDKRVAVDNQRKLSDVSALEVLQVDTHAEPKVS